MRDCGRRCRSPFPTRRTTPAAAPTSSARASRRWCGSDAARAIASSAAISLDRTRSSCARICVRITSSSRRPRRNTTSHPAISSHSCSPDLRRRSPVHTYRSSSGALHDTSNPFLSAGIFRKGLVLIASLRDLSHPPPTLTPQSKPMQLTYHPAVFHANDIAQAMAIIMTPEGSTTAERWETETPYLADLIAQELTITAHTLLLDYGCRIGRLAYALIQPHNCR